MAKLKKISSTACILNWLIVVRFWKICKTDVTSPRYQSQPRPCVDGQQDKTCKQLLGGNTRNRRQQTMTHAPVNLPEPLCCPYIPKGHCGYARAFLRVMVMCCVCEAKRAQQDCCQNRKSSMGCKRWGICNKGAEKWLIWGVGLKSLGAMLIRWSHCRYLRAGHKCKATIKSDDHVYMCAYIHLHI